jgi:hypothetical protein
MNLKEQLKEVLKSLTASNYIIKKQDEEIKELKGKITKLIHTTAHLNDPEGGRKDKK